MKLSYSTPSTMYIATTAAVISHSVLPSAARKAVVAPELGGDVPWHVEIFSARVTASTASPSE